MDDKKVFYSPISDNFINREFDPIIRHAKACQLDYSLEKIKNFSFFKDNDRVKSVKNVQK